MNRSISVMLHHHLMSSFYPESLGQPPCGVCIALFQKRFWEYDKFNYVLFYIYTTYAKPRRAYMVYVSIIHDT